MVLKEFNDVERSEVVLHFRLTSLIAEMLNGAELRWTPVSADSGLAEGGRVRADFAVNKALGNAGFRNSLRL